MPYAVLSAPNTTSTEDKLRVWVQGGHHGNEPAGDESALALLGALDANQTWTASLLEHLEIIVLPRYNPDGVFYFQRELASNYDPNRDHVKLEREHTINAKQLYNDFDPHISIDLHELSAPNVFGGRYQHGSDAFIAPGKHPLIHQSIRDLSEGLFSENISRDLERRGLRVGPYATKQSGNSSDILLWEAPAEARMASNAWGLRQAISFLLEFRGIGLAEEHFQRRVSASLFAISSIIQTAADHKEEIYSTLKDAVSDFKTSTSDVIVTYHNDLIKREYTFVDTTNGSVVTPQVDFLPTKNLQANLTRPRPEAYIIPKPWAAIAEKLRTLGVEVQTLDEAWTGPVESLKISTISFASQYYEGALQATVTTNATRTDKTLPAGSFYVDARQKNAALAFVALEPESVDSYVTHNIIPVRQGDEYPVFRVLA